MKVETDALPSVGRFVFYSGGSMKHKYVMNREAIVSGMLGLFAIGVALAMVIPWLVYAIRFWVDFFR